MMYKALAIVLLLLLVAFSGCEGSNPPNEVAPAQVQKIEIEHANTNLDGKIVDVKFYPTDVRAGEMVTAELVVANTGTETIKSESVGIKVKVKTLEDSMANIYLKTMSDEKKTRSLDPINFDTEITPGTNKPISAVFHTIKEMEGRSLAGTYDVTITLAVNGEKVESIILPITLRSGTPREFTPTPQPTPTPAPAPTPESTLTQTPTPSPTPSPTPTPEPVIVVTPTGVVSFVKIYGGALSSPVVKIHAGDTVEWNNDDDNTYTLVEKDRKLSNITIREGKRIRYIFNTTGDYHFNLIFFGLRTAPKEQEVVVKANASQ